MILLLWSSSVASAQGCGADFTEFELRTLVDASEAAVFDDDTLTHKQMYAEFVRRVPCLDHQLPKDVWARLLLDEAVVRFATKADWQPILETALGIFPDLNVPKHILEQYVRAPAPRFSDTPVPSYATLFVDGVLQPRIPLISGEHVVQVWRDGKWHSEYVDPGTPVPAEWLAPDEAPVEDVPEPGEWVPRGRGGVGIAFGALVANQFVEGEGTWLSDARLVGGNAILGTRGFQPVADSTGVFWDLALRFGVPSVRRLGGTPVFDASPQVLPSAYIGPSYVLENAAFGVGGGAFVLQKVEGDVVSAGVYPQVRLVAEGRAARATFGLAGGGSPSAVHVAMYGGWVLTAGSPVAARFGFDTNLEAVWFTEAPPGDRTASALQLGVVGRIDLVWGADR